MKILIVNNMAPFIWGGAEELAHHLHRNLLIAGHEAEIMRIPFQWEPATKIPAQMLMMRTFELTNVDRVIALKFPAYLIRHPHKTLWLLHQYRQAYDLYEVGQSNLPDNPLGQAIRELIIQGDNESFAECKKIFTNSDVTRQRLLHYNQFTAAVLAPPLNDPELFGGSASQGYIFAGGRINSTKRQHLLIEALALASKETRLIIAGPPDTPEDAKRLIDLTRQLKLEKRVKLDLRFLPRQIYADYINQAAAVAYLPFDEDSLGYVTMEAATAGKALISTYDSGGVLALVKNLQTGLVTLPDAAALANALSIITAQPHFAELLGKTARQVWLAMDLNWTKTIEKLLS